MTSQPVNAVLERFRNQKAEVESDIRRCGPHFEFLSRRAGGVAFRDEETPVMLAMSADLLSGKTQGKSRWEILSEQPAAYDHDEAREINALAHWFGMVRSSPAALRLQDVPDEKKVVIAEGGAKWTSILRRKLAVSALQNPITGAGQVYQLGSGRLIQPVRPDGSPNEEYGIALKAAPRLSIYRGRPLSEYSLNVATAVQEGWRIHASRTDELYRRGSSLLEEAYALDKADAPMIASIKPTPEPHGRASLRTGIAAVHQIESLDGKCVAVATTSQYGTKAELATGLELSRLGVQDAAICTVTDTEYKTTDIYALEIAVLLRQFAALD